jgi:muramoyltetrapeptide carboxypeptidase
MSLVKPRALRPGSIVGIAAPGSPVDAEALSAGESLLRDAGFEVRYAADLLARSGYLAGDDTRRAREWMDLVRDPEVEAIVCARGGYGCDRIIDSLDADAVRAARKPLVGYSDITVLLQWQLRCAGLVGFHGPMLDRGADVDAGAVATLFDQLQGREELPVVFPGCAGGGGRAEGVLVGGSLTMLVASLGTSWEVETAGAILMLEDIGERPYRIDRMLQQLRSAGKLASVAGIGIGAFTQCEDAKYPEPSVDDVIREVLAPLAVPVVTGLPFGHVANNYAWPLGGRATMDGDRGELLLVERGVES